jgi:hypothetical protein
MTTDWVPAGVAGAFAAVLGFLKWALGRHSDLVDLLRRELDKALTRGNAERTAVRILVYAIDAEPNPSPAMIAARSHAREVIAAAAAQLSKGE